MFRIFVEVKENVIIINVVQYHEPSAVALVAEPIRHQPQNVNIWIVSLRQLDLGCNVSITLCESGSIARVYPKHPSLWRRLFDSVCVFDGNLRLPRADLDCFLPRRHRVSLTLLPLDRQGLLECDFAGLLVYASSRSL